jgi:hypothetical protein
MLAFTCQQELAEKSGFADAARAMDMENGEERVRRRQRALEELAFHLASDELALARK